MRTVILLGEETGSDGAVLTAHLAAQATRSGATPPGVAILEPAEGSVLVQWSKARGGRTPVVWETPLEELAERMRGFEQTDCRFCFVHIAPEWISQALSVIESADVLVLPVRCDRRDDEIGGTVEALREICGRHGAIGPAVAGILLRPGEARGPRGKALAGLKGPGMFRLQWGEEPAAAMHAGSTVMESRPASLAAREIVELWAGLRKFMGGK